MDWRAKEPSKQLFRCPESVEVALGKIGQGWNGNLKERYTETIESDLKKRYDSNLETSDNINKILCWFFHHHFVLNPNKPENVRRVCKATSKFRGTSFIDVLLIGSDLMRSLWGIILRFQEKPVALSADIEDMFLQVEVEIDDRNYLRFLERKDAGEIQILQYTGTDLEKRQQRALIFLYSSAQ